MSLDITPLIPTGRSLIQSHGNNRFKITGDLHQGSVIVFIDSVENWQAVTIEDITIDSLLAVTKRSSEVDILLVGCGETFTLPPKDLRLVLKQHGIVLEWMDSRAACRTFNVLLAEERPAAAAILAIE